MMYYSIAFMVCDKDNATFNTIVKAENPEKACTILTDYWNNMGKTITIYSIKEQHFLGYQCEKEN